MSSKIFDKAVRALGLTVFVGTAAAACSSKEVRPNTRLPQSEGNLVTIRNNHWLDARVYVFRFGARYAVGIAPGLQTSTMRVPRNLMLDHTVRLQIDPIGSNTSYTSDQILVSPGQRIELTVHSRISMSSFAVWNR
jgi:hypothetical protein